MSLQSRYKIAAPAPAVEGKRWFTITEAADYMAAHLWFVRELIRTGKIPHQKLGRGYVLDKIDMDRFLENNKAA
jgi:excisionase family DNA binding protein